MYFDSTNGNFNKGKLTLYIPATLNVQIPLDISQIFARDIWIDLVERKKAVNGTFIRTVVPSHECLTLRDTE